MSTIRQSGLGRLRHVAKVGVEVGADRLVGEEGRGLRAVFDGLNPERVIIASISAGIGRYAIRKAVRYARNAPSGAPPSPAIRASLTRWPRRKSISKRLA
jgi:alkylation response protein AidB-like acyl-CoA dehydrogenase